MSTHQRIHVRTMLVVDRATADVLRIEAKKVAMFEHDLFEDFLDFYPDAQHSLALRYRDVFDLIDAVGWDPGKADPTVETYDVPLTYDLINMLRLRQHDLARTNADRRPDEGLISPETLAEITTNQRAITSLNRVFRAYGKARKAAGA